MFRFTTTQIFQNGTENRISFGSQNLDVYVLSCQPANGFGKAVWEVELTNLHNPGYEFAPVERLYALYCNELGVGFATEVVDNSLAEWEELYDAMIERIASKKAHTLRATAA